MSQGPELSRTKLKLDKARSKAKEAEVKKQILQDLQVQLSEQLQDKYKDSTDVSGERAKKMV